MKNTNFIVTFWFYFISTALIKCFDKNQLGWERVSLNSQFQAMFWETKATRTSSITSHPLSGTERTRCMCMEATLFFYSLGPKPTFSQEDRLMLLNAVKAISHTHSERSHDICSLILRLSSQPVLPWNWQS